MYITWRLKLRREFFATEFLNWIIARQWACAYQLAYLKFPHLIWTKRSCMQITRRRRLCKKSIAEHFRMLFRTIPKGTLTQARNGILIDFEFYLASLRWWHSPMQSGMGSRSSIVSFFDPHATDFEGNNLKFLSGGTVNTF